MLYHKDKVVAADRPQASGHIYQDHDYAEKLQAGRLAGIVKEGEKKSARLLARELAELSFIQE